MTRMSSRDPAVAGRVADARPRLGVPLFPDGEPIADVDHRDSAGGPEAGPADRGSPGADHVGEADADHGHVEQPTFDSARLEWPMVGLATYALEPGGPVTLEVHSDGQVYSFTAPTEAEALLLAFPPRTGDVFG
jgi:hypothetical protein